MQCGGIALHARPVAVPGEQNAIGDTQGAEDAPTGEQAYLSGSQGKVGGFLNLVVVENELVQHPLILACGHRWVGTVLMRRASWGRG